jgi:hypothetical protein
MSGITWWTEARREIARRMSRQHRRHLTPGAVCLVAAMSGDSLCATLMWLLREDG